jgi:peroxiredoxin
MKLRSIAIFMLGTGWVVGGAACAAATASAPAGAPATSPARRSYVAITADIRKEQRLFRENLPAGSAISDPAKRAAAAPKLIPIMNRTLGYLRELRETQIPQGVIAANREIPFFTASLALFGDKDTLAQLEHDAKASPSPQSVNAQGSLLMVRWVDAAHDPAAQKKILDQSRQLAREHPRNDHLTDVLINMAEVGPATKDLSHAINDVALSMNTPMATQIKEQADRDQKLAALNNKPLVIEGNTPDGTHFSTADWKGKVILVDFWASWCPNCLEELPRVTKTYAQFHEQGLEVLGISSDHDPAQLKQFLAQNHDMPWPQLFDPKNLDWNPIATSLGVESLPTMFLIDKKGIVRSVSATEDMEVQIPQLLAEKD